MAGTEFVFRIKGDASGAVSASNEAGKAVGGVKKEVGVLNDALGKMGTMVAGAFAVGSIIAFGKEVAKATGQLQSLQTRLEGIYGSAAAGNKALDSLRMTADKLGLNFSELSENFTQFVSAAKASGMEVSKAEKIFNNMSVAIAGSGASSEQASRAMTALTQMIGKGKISAEEMRGQLGEALPQAMGWLAKSLNMTVGEVGKLIDSGKLSTDVLLKFSATAAEAMGPNVQKMAEGLNGQINRLENSWTQFKQTLGESGAIEMAVSALSGLIKAVDKAYYSLNLLMAAGSGDFKKVAQIAANTYDKSVTQFEIKAEESAKKQVEAYLKIKAGSKDLGAQLIKEAQSHERVASITERTAKVMGKQTEQDTVIILNEKAKAKAFRDAAKELEKNNTVTNTHRELTKEEIKAQEKQRKEQEALAASIAKTTREIDRQMIAYALAHSGEKENMVGPQMPDWYAKSLEKSRQAKKDADEEEARSKKEADERDKRDAAQKEADDKKRIQDKKDRNLEMYQSIGNSAATLTGLISAGYEKQSIELRKSLESGEIDQKQYEERIRQIKKKEFIANKIAAIGEIIINTAVQSTAKPELMPFIIANGAAQAAVVAAQPIPYAKGTKKVPMLTGAVRGKDSVHAILMPDERVVPADTNMMPGYHELLNDIQDRRISPDMAMFLHEAAAGRIVGGGSRGLDEERLGDIFARAISRIPSPAFSIDERGVAVISQRAQFREQQIRRKL